MPRLSGIPPVSKTPNPNTKPDDPFQMATTGQPSFLASLKSSALASATLITDDHNLPESVPARFQLFTSKEVDSGIVYAETPSVPPSLTSLSIGTSGGQPGVYTPESSFYSGGAPASIAELLHVGATDSPQLARLLAHHFRLVQLTAPRTAIAFVGNLPATMTDVEMTWILSGMFVGCGVIVSRKVWHKPTALIQFRCLDDAVEAIHTVHVLGGRVLRVVPSVHAF